MSPRNKVKQQVGPLSKWLQAAEDARLKLNVHRRKIRRLQKAIRLFEKYAKSGEPWPGEAA